MSEQVEKEIVAIVAEVAGVAENEVSLDANLAKDLEIDSIKAIEIVVAIEKKYKISVRDEDIPAITTVRQIVSLAATLLDTQANKPQN